MYVFLCIKPVSLTSTRLHKMFLFYVNFPSLIK